MQDGEHRIARDNVASSSFSCTYSDKCQRITEDKGNSDGDSGKIHQSITGRVVVENKTARVGSESKESNGSNRGKETNTNGKGCRHDLVVLGKCLVLQFVVKLSKREKGDVDKGEH